MSLRELKIPKGAYDESSKDESVELARIWWIRNRPEFVLAPLMKDPRNVGLMLYEAAFHFSQVYASEGRGEAADVLAAIKQGWDEGQHMPIATQMIMDQKPDAPKDGKKN